MLIREKEGTKEVLLALRKNTGYRDGEYELPGGHVEEGEDLMHAMVREAKEELMINIKEEDLKIAHVLHHYTGNRVNFILTTNIFEGIPSVGEPEKCEKIEWFNINDLPENTTKKVKKSMQEINSNIFYSSL
jgi:8-oxo-dGTP pyrophosphatase MutT (NUDIX family)